MFSRKKLILFCCFISMPFIGRADVPVRIPGDEYPFMQANLAMKKRLPKLPSKAIAASPYCSQINLLVDQAPKIEPLRRAGLKADRIVVSKTRRTLYLMSHGSLISEYKVSFGFGSLDGAKAQTGDGRTPEGTYQVDFKKNHSSYAKALHVSYPNDQDEAFAAKYKVSPGGSIMIHGFPPQPVDGLDPLLIPQIHGRVDWTAGCMAVTTDEIKEIYEMVDEGASVEICALDPSHEMKTVSSGLADDVSPTAAVEMLGAAATNKLIPSGAESNPDQDPAP